MPIKLAPHQRGLPELQSVLDAMGDRIGSEPLTGDDLDDLQAGDVLYGIYALTDEETGKRYVTTSGFCMVYDNEKVPLSGDKTFTFVSCIGINGDGDKISHGYTASDLQKNHILYKVYPRKDW